MQLLYPIYYRQYGIRRLQQLLIPRLYSEDFFSFPKNAIYHHVSHDLNDLAPNQEQNYFHNYRKRIFMDVVTEMTENKGNARRIATAPQNLYRPFFLKNRLFKFTRNAIEVNKDPQTLTAIDYGYLQKLYRYTHTPLTGYYEWHNIEKTVWDNILTTCRKSERQNFLFFKVPDILPSVPMLRQYSNKVNNVFMHIFDTHEKRFILELWRWIDPVTRKETLLGNFEQEDLDKVNLVLTHNGKWCILNLGVFNKWRKEPRHNEATTSEESSNEETVVDKSKTTVATVGYLPPQFQKLMLKLFISIQTQTILDPNSIVKKKDSNKTSELSHTENQEIDDNDDEQEVEHKTETETTVKVDVEIDKSEKLHELGPESDPEDLSRLDLDEKAFEELEKDLKALEYIEQKNLMLKGVNQNTHSTGIVENSEIKQQEKKEITFEASEEEIQDIHKQIFTEHEPAEALKQYIDRHAEYGLMSAAEYRKVQKQADAFMESKSGYKPEKSIRDFIKIEDHEVKITKEEIKIPEITTVPDKGMLESSLLTFDKKYIKNVLPKDITAMIVNIQRAGIIVQDYQIEQESNVLGAYEIHTVRIKPVDGVASTVRFKLPKVDDEGNLYMNGNKYHLRKQRADWNFYYM